METKKPELAKLRKQAGLSQSDLAEQLEITQSQVAECEKKGKVPTHLLRRWARALGVTVDELLPPEPIETASFDFDNSLYATLTEDLNLLLQYIDKNFPNPEKGDEKAISPTVPQFRDQVTALKEKPWVVVTGHFDAGKSQLCNFLLGGGNLPTGYRPVTKFPTYVHHSADRPDWVTESLCLMGSDFDPKKWQDKEHFNEHRLIGGSWDIEGSWDILEEHANRKSVGASEVPVPIGIAHSANPKNAGNSEDDEQRTVLAFVDAPLLHSCVLVDLPGYDDKRIKASLIDQAGQQAAVLLYVSRAQGFLDGGDFTRLGYLLRSIPHFEMLDDKFPTLGNLFIIASHAHPGIKTEQLKTEILEGGAREFYEHFEGTLFTDLKKQIGRDISRQDVANRFFSFWQEEPSRREKLEKGLYTLLGTHIPTVVKNNASAGITKFKEEGTARYAQEIEKWETLLRKRNEGKDFLQKLKETEPDRQKRHKRMAEMVQKNISTFESLDLEKTQRLLRDETDIKTLEKMIEKRYSDKKTAQKFAANYVLEKVQSKAAHIRAELVDDLKNSIEDFLQDAQIATFQNEKWGEVAVPIDTKAAFLGGLAGASTLAGLGAWAAGLGNLGGYIAVAKGASLLSALGISTTAGTAGATSAVAALGGPITLGLGIAIGAAALVWRIFAGNWRYRLAKKIKQVFEEERVLLKLEDNIKSFWDNTRTAFQKGADNMDIQYRNYLKEMETAFGGPQEDLRVLELRINRYQELKSFFSAIPWRWKT